ncbi:hypothetical protein ACL03H_02720 [Saccharopolyspora sp. MS10]|uniref:hypothetical protein n=1 Tax=Saccharopolyspora sp. MS10 TaxID=3385973 RepID=UPI0039A1E9D0
MGDGFRVDLSALTDAYEGVHATIESMGKRQVSDIDAPADAFGHDRLADAVADFCDRWNDGVSNLVEDAKEISGRLAQCLHAYRQTDEAARAHLEGIVQCTNGEDPAAE